MDVVIGVCSLCGGEVVNHLGPWYGIIPPKPYCSKCGATEKPNLPVIQMEHAAPVQVTTTTNPSIATTNPNPTIT